MDPEDKEEYAASAKFMRAAVAHISKATEAQKRDLLKVLLERPPEVQALELAETSIRGLTEKEFMKLCAAIQKNFDPEFWTFATRLRTTK